MKAMPVDPSRLRAWILVLAGALVAAITAFFLYGRWQGRRLGHDLPGGLGSTIQQSTRGFTYSESRGGHTIYTLHASKAVQYKSSGHAELHDVSITLYGAQGAPANRIYGSDFDWDPIHGIARAMGEVQIDFQGTATAAPPAGKAAEEDGENRNTVHVKTSGLVFNKQTGLASTTEKIEFRLAEAAGTATGASFDSQTGIVILAADVAFNSSLGGNPLAVRARHAQFDRSSRLLYLLQDVTDYADSHTSSDQATVSFRADGSAYQVEAKGNVILAGADGQRIDTRSAHLDLGPKSEPQQAVLDGGLLYVANNADRVLHGSAGSGTFLFGPKPTIRHAQLRTAVSVVDEEKLPQVDAARSKQNFPTSNSRQLQASQVDVDFTSGADLRPEARQIFAAGGARLNVHSIYSRTPPEDTTVKADQLFATLLGEEILSTLRGTGHTSLVSITPNGVTQTSQGDNLLLTFAPPQTAKPKGKATGGKADTAAPQLQSAVQLGNVTLVQQGAVAAGGQIPPPVTATAQRAAYDAASQIAQLSGGPRIQDSNGELAAALIELERTSGNANATGGVKATYRQAKGKQGGAEKRDLAFGGPGPVHVVADHAHLDHATDLTTFYGSAGNPARLWQESDSVTAPVLELSQAHDTLSAHGPSDAAAVTAVFISAGKKTPGTVSVVRLESHTLLYSGNEHKAVFSGAVVAQTSSGVLHSSLMDVYFSPAGGVQQPTKTQPTAGMQPNGDVSQTVPQTVAKIVARGAVELEQPGRKGTGEELTYTAADGKFILTGTSTAAPRLTDKVRGTVTGNALIFNDRDDSVVVSGGDSRAVTQTQVAK